MNGFNRPTLFPSEDRFSFCPNSSPMISWKAVRAIGDHHLFVRGSVQYRH